MEEGIMQIGQAVYSEDDMIDILYKQYREILQK